MSPATKTESKVCPKCKEPKPITEFLLAKTGKKAGKRAVWCNACNTKHKQAWVTANLERFRAYGRARYAASREKFLKRSSENYQANRKAKIAAGVKYKVKRYKADPAFRLLVCLSARLRMALNGKLKASKILDLVGCTKHKLVLHIQGQFRPGMDWKNHGSVWHIDHIKPCAQFHLVKEAEQRDCFHWTNLQPLFGSENIKKGSKWNP